MKRSDTNAKELQLTRHIMKNVNLLSLWIDLAERVRVSAVGLKVVCDEPGDLRIETQEGRPFATVRIQKSHVGLYLLPLYYHPSVLVDELRPLKSGHSTIRFRPKNVKVLPCVNEQIDSLLPFIGHY